MLEMICRYMSFRAYGFKNATPDCNQTGCKSAILLNFKKKISFFMINRLPTWDEIHKTCNPSKSAIINDPIGALKKKETHGQGKSSCADRPFEPSEFSQVLTLLQESDDSDFDRKYRYPAMLKFMFHFVAHGDDAAHVFKSSLKPSTEYHWMLTCKLCWSKNVCEHCDCPH